MTTRNFLKRLLSTSSLSQQKVKNFDIHDPINFTLSESYNTPKTGYEKTPSWQRLTKWANSVQNRDMQSVLNCYSKNGTLWPTLSKDFRNTKQNIEPYFEGFLKRIDGSVLLIPHGCMKMGDDHYYWSGTSRFELEDGVVANARFTYITKFEVDLVNGQEECEIMGVTMKGDWKILHHHSSLMPEA